MSGVLPAKPATCSTHLEPNLAISLTCPSGVTAISRPSSPPEQNPEAAGCGARLSHRAVMHRDLVPALEVEQRQAAIAEREGGVRARTVEAGGDDVGAKLRHNATGFQEFIKIGHGRFCAELHRGGQGRRGRKEVGAF